MEPYALSLGPYLNGLRDLLALQQALQQGQVAGGGRVAGGQQLVQELLGGHLVLVGLILCLCTGARWPLRGLVLRELGQGMASCAASNTAKHQHTAPWA
jgi:hypothetical protein